MKTIDDDFPDEFSQNGKVLAYWDEELECYIFPSASYNPNDLEQEMDAKTDHKLKI